MADLLFALSSSPGTLPGQGQGRNVNAYVEKHGDTMNWLRPPGLVSYSQPNVAGYRGMIDVDGTIYLADDALGGLVGKVAPGGAFSLVAGSLPGGDGVSFAYNNRVTSGAYTRDIVAVRETGGAYVIAPDGVSSYPSPNLPANVNSVSILGPFFVFTVPDGRVFASGVNSTSVDALSFATAESAPDGLVRGIVHQGRFYAFGNSTTEVLTNAGSSPFPLVRAPQVIQVGLKTAMAVAGFEPGWDRVPMFVATDDTVRRLDGGFTPTVVSTPDVERFIGKSAVNSLEASVYTFRGHAIWSISSDQGTWAYDLATGAWHERKSEGLNRWRVGKTVKSGATWKGGDVAIGVVHEIREDSRTEAGQPLTFQVTSAPLRAFPQRSRIGSIIAHFTKAGADVLIEASLDGGSTFERAESRSLASVDVDPARVDAIGLASHHGLIVRLTVTSDADFSFLGAAAYGAEPRTP